MRELLIHDNKSKLHQPAVYKKRVVEIYIDMSLV